MSLIERMKNSLRADAHGVVDALEDEALVLKQCLRDAQAEVQRKRERLRELERDGKRLAGERERAQKECERAERDAELAISQQRDDLARYSLKQALTQRSLGERIEALLAQAAEEHKELEATLQVQEVSLEELRERVQAFLAQRDSRCTGPWVAPISDEQVELELLRRKESSSRPQSESEEGRHAAK